MTKFHTTVSRRDFMKGLGFTGAGLGALSLVNPVFHDLDELAASTGANRRNPWWIKQRPIHDPTVEVDWDMIEPYQSGPARSHVKGQANVWRQEQSRQNGEITSRLTSDNKGHWSRKHSAVRTAANYWATTNRDGLGTATDPETKWTGTPEEAANVFRAGLSYLGMAEINFTKIDDKTSRLENLQPHEDAGLRSVVVAMARKDTALGRFGSSDSYSYSHCGLLRRRMQEFTNALGYNSRLINGANVPWGVLSGQSELSRMDHAVSPRFGAAHKQHLIMATDVNLPQESPIDAGITKFCYTCKVCAESCHIQSHDGVNALSMETEPTWEQAIGPPDENGWHYTDYKRLGVKKWFCDYWHCNCIRACWTDCTFNQLNYAFAHDLIRITSSVTPIFNGFFSEMDRVFDYGKKPKSYSYEGYQNAVDGIEKWWNRDLNTWKHDVHLSGDNLH